jgi:AraC-like DNA-binding protein
MRWLPYDAAVMIRPFLEHIAASQEGSWTLFDRRLPAIPFEWHYNDEYELTLTLNSRGQRYIGDSIAPYTDGDLVLIGPRIPHTWCSNGDIDRRRKHNALVLWFSQEFVAKFVASAVELRPVMELLTKSSRAIEFSPQVKVAARERICAMLRQTASERLPALLQLLLLLTRDKRAKPLLSTGLHGAIISGREEERIARVLTHLNQHYRDEPSVDELMEIAALSRSSLHRLFKLQTGMTTREYLMRLRVGNACALLLNSDRPISLIADEVGYRNLANFNRQFRELKGRTPGEFRRALMR